MDQHSINQLNLLHPYDQVRAAAIEGYNKAVKDTPINVHPVIDESLRSWDRSDALYKLGRTVVNPDGKSIRQPMGNIVTNAPGGYSWHNFGLAFDFYLLINGHQFYPADAEAAKNNKSWMIVVNIFKDMGWRWGGEFGIKLQDAPHLENQCGTSLSNLRALHKAGKFIDGTNYIKF